MIYILISGSPVPPAGLTVGYGHPPADPWPRILRLLAILTLLYGAAHIGSLIFTARIIWPFNRVAGIAASPGEYWLWGIMILMTLLLSATLIVGSTMLLRKGVYQLIVWASWSFLILWPITLVASLLLSPQQRSYSMLINNLLYGAEYYIFPLLVVLVLRAHRLRYARAITTRPAH